MTAIYDFLRNKTFQGESSLEKKSLKEQKSPNFRKKKNLIDSHSNFLFLSILPGNRTMLYFKASIIFKIIISGGSFIQENSGKNQLKKE